LNPEEDAEKLSGKAERTLEPGTVLAVRSPGGGGYGDPNDRDAESVREDYTNGLLSAETASQVYGVDADSGAAEAAGSPDTMSDS
jgi:N-methylhydantoinase B